MVKQFTRWLGPFRVRILIGTLVISGLISLLLNIFARNAAWSITAQTVLVLVFLLIVTLTVSSRLHARNQQKMSITLLPALGLAALGIVLPQFLPLLLGGALGWLFISQIFVRDRLRMEYKTAIKHMRNKEYKQAIRVMTDLINSDKDNPDHYLFRAQINRLASKLDAAEHDYRRVINLAPLAANGYNGLSEVYFQMGKYDLARENAAEAYRLEPDYWVAPYNLGMVEDRLEQSEAVIEHMQTVLNQGLPDSRHRLLTYLWLARAYYRLGNNEGAEQSLTSLRKEAKGLKEWQTILDDEQGKIIRRILEEDIQLAEKAMNKNLHASDLFR
jgi:tetratricopeptide (TPR) repeat protein